MMNSWALAARLASFTASSSASPLPYRMLSRIVPPKQDGLLRHQRDLPIPTLQRDITETCPIDGHAPFGRIIKPMDQIHQGSLACTGRTHNCHTFPGFTSNDTSINTARRGSYGKAHMFCGELALIRCEVQGRLGHPGPRAGYPGFQTRAQSRP